MGFFFFFNVSIVIYLSITPAKGEGARAQASSFEAGFRHRALSTQSDSLNCKFGFSASA